MLRDRLIPDIWFCDSHRHISYLILTCIHLIIVMLYLTLDIWHRYLPCYIWHMISDAGTCHAIFDTWYLPPVLAMLYLTLDTDTGTCHAIFDTWYLTPVLAMLYLTLDIWHRYLPCYTWHLISDTGTWYVITWPDIMTPDWILLHLYYLTYSWLSLLRGLGMIIILLPDLWYSCTPELLYSWTPVSPDSCPLHCYSY